MFEQKSKEVRITDPVTGGQKGQKPERYSLIPVHALEEVARVYGYGAAKYAPNNYLKGYDWSLSLDALKRHVAEFEKGLSKDDESGLPHMAHAVFHCMALIMFERFKLGTDDRWKEPKKPENKWTLSFDMRVKDHKAFWEGFNKSLEGSVLQVPYGATMTREEPVPDTEREPEPPVLRVGARVRVDSVGDLFDGMTGTVTAFASADAYPWTVFFSEHEDSEADDGVFTSEDLEVLS